MHTKIKRSCGFLLALLLLLALFPVPVLARVDATTEQELRDALGGTDLNIRIRGSFAITQDLTMSGNNCIVTVSEGYTLTINSGVTFTVNNAGGNECLTVDGLLINNGTIQNSVYLVLGLPSGTVTNQATGTIVNTGTITLTGSGNVLNNSGTITNNNGCTIDNQGTLNNKTGGGITNNGTIKNTYGTINSENGSSYSGDAPTDNPVIHHPAVTGTNTPSGTAGAVGAVTATATLEGANFDSGNITFTATAGGKTAQAVMSANGTLTFNFIAADLNTLAANSYDITVSSSANATNAAVTGVGIGTLTVAPAPVLSANPNPLAFGNVKVDDASSPQTLTVGGADLTNDISYTKGGANPVDFTVTEESWAAATGGTLSVTFTPSAVGTRSATLTVKSTGAQDLVVNLTGSGTTSPSPTPTPPAISGPASLTLAQGYAATTSGAFTLTGTEPLTVTLDNDHGGKISWDGAAKRLNIAAGLAPGRYPVVLTATGGAAPKATHTFTLTVAAAPAISGPASLSLAEGYAAATSEAFTLTGAAPVAVALDSDHGGKITWDGATNRLSIAAGLEAGSYPVVLTATDATGQAATHSFTLTVKAKDIPGNSGWYQDGHGRWYYYGPDGKPLFGWHKIDGNWYYFNADGIMLTGWLWDSANWHYLAGHGAMATGWVWDGGGWFYMRDFGAMAIGWVWDGANWYYMRDFGAMATGWAYVNGCWYFLGEGGAMAVGWVRSGDVWYFMDANGAMVTGEVVIDGQANLFDQNGAWLGVA